MAVGLFDKVLLTQKIDLINTIKTWFLKRSNKIIKIVIINNNINTFNNLNVMCVNIVKEFLLSQCNVDS